MRLLIIALTLAFMASTTYAGLEEEDPDAIVTAKYTDPVINFGPVSFGLSALPAEVNTSVFLGTGFPTGGGATGWGLSEVLSANLIFCWCELLSRRP